jgi:tRNA 2-thiouridine synthesizing protein A
MTFTSGSPEMTEDKTHDTDVLLDVTGFQCPIPVLKARRAVRNMTPGDILTVLATDPASMIDFKHFCNTTGHELLDSSESDDIYKYVIRVTE